MPKFSHTILVAVTATLAVLAIAACGGSSKSGTTGSGSSGSNGGGSTTVNGWTAADVNKLKTKFDAAISKAKTELPASSQAQYQTAADTFLNCTLSVVEPVATPQQALTNNWQPSKAVQTKIANQCEAPFAKSVQSLIPTSG